MLNYWALFACGLLSVVLGSIWYGPLFGKAWMKWLNVTPEQAKNYPKSLMIRSYVLAFISSLLLVFVLGNTLAYGGALEAWQGAVGGAMNWLGFVVPVTLSGVLWENKPWKIFWITVGYYLVFLTLSGAILVSWK